MAEDQDEDAWLYGNSEETPAKNEDELPPPDDEPVEKDETAGDKAIEICENNSPAANVGRETPEIEEGAGEEEDEKEGKATAEEGEGEDEDEDEDDDDDDVQVTIGPVSSTPAFGPGGGAYVGQGVNLTIKSQHDVLASKGGIAKGVDVDAVGSINGVSIYEFDLDTVEDKPWRRPGADLSDYFNYGFTEDTWKMYCEKQRRVRVELHMQKKIQVHQGQRDVMDESKQMSGVPPPMMPPPPPPQSMIPPMPFPMMPPLGPRMPLMPMPPQMMPPQMASRMMRPPLQPLLPMRPTSESKEVTHEGEEGKQDAEEELLPDGQPDEEKKPDLEENESEKKIEDSVGDMQTLDDGEKGAEKKRNEGGRQTPDDEMASSSPAQNNNPSGSQQQPPSMPQGGMPGMLPPMFGGMMPGMPPSGGTPPFMAPGGQGPQGFPGLLPLPGMGLPMFPSGPDGMSPPRFNMRGMPMMPPHMMPRFPMMPGRPPMFMQRGGRGRPDERPPFFPPGRGSMMPMGQPWDPSMMGTPYGGGSGGSGPPGGGDSFNKLGAEGTDADAGDSRDGGDGADENANENGEPGGDVQERKKTWAELRAERERERQRAREQRRKEWEREQERNREREQRRKERDEGSRRSRRHDDEKDRQGRRSRHESDRKRRRRRSRDSSSSEDDRRHRKSKRPKDRPRGRSRERLENRQSTGDESS